MERVRTSKVWRFYNRKDNCVATCKICSQDYSYRSSVSNLMKHIRKKHCHILQLQNESELNNSDTSDGEHEVSIQRKKKKSTWHFYEVLDSDKFEATCKLCGTNVHYDSVSDLVKHVRDEHGEEPMDSDEEYEPEVEENRSKRLVSKSWNYFKIVDSQAKLAKCLVCSKKLSYSASVSNLKRHLLRKHKAVVGFGEDGEESKKMIISANGQLYEVDTESSKIEIDSDEKEPLEMDTIYLEDLEDSLDELPPSRRLSTTPSKKKTIIPIKRNFSSITKEQVTNIRNTCSENEPPRKRYSSETMGTLDYFGQYVVSLLKDLPKPVSDQLQSEIIKQILTSKMALETQGPPNYKITISQSNICEENTSKVENIKSVTVIDEPIDISETTEEVINDGPKELPNLDNES